MMMKSIFFWGCICHLIVICIDLVLSFYFLIVMISWLSYLNLVFCLLVMGFFSILSLVVCCLTFLCPLASLLFLVVFMLVIFFLFDLSLSSKISILYELIHFLLEVILQMVFLLLDLSGTFRLVMIAILNILEELAHSFLSELVRKDRSDLYHEMEV